MKTRTWILLAFALFTLSTASGCWHRHYCNDSGTSYREKESCAPGR